ncbi:MAG: hypothetical protein ABI639_08465 [Thermoanaerobaculia bacterium]
MWARVALGLTVASTLACSSSGAGPGRGIPEPLIVEMASEPQLGAPAPADFASSRRVLVGPSQLDPSYIGRFGDVDFDVAVGNDGTTSYVATDDPDFEAPEGARVGNPFSALLPEHAEDAADAEHAAGTEVVREPGWGCHIALDSGWHAATSMEGHACGEKVLWLFKRRN